MNNITGHKKLLEQLHADGFRYIFGNPGSSEEGLIDSLKHFPEIEYILSLQESIAVAAADGYCRSAQKPACVLIHAGVGLGNALGIMYQANRGHSPLIILCGEAGISRSPFESQMAVDLVAMARPVTKYAARVEHPASLLRMLRRVIKEAMTPPEGPVFLALPQDILDAENDEIVAKTVAPNTRVAPKIDDITEVARILVSAKHPLILMGDGVSRSNAQRELAVVAEKIGAKVWGVNDSEINLPRNHPLHCGTTGHMFGEDSEKIVRNADAVLVVGTYLFPEVFPLLQHPFSPETKIIHIDLNAHEIAKNHPVDISFVADPKSTLAVLIEAIRLTSTRDNRDIAAERVKSIALENGKRLSELRSRDEQNFNSTPLNISAFGSILAKKLPKDAIIFDESLTYSAELTRWLPVNEPGSFFQTRGGSLGVGFPGAIGIKLANPHRTVIGLSGDGGSLYTIQALWTAAHHQIDAKFVVCNNIGYRLLKYNLLQYWQTMATPKDTFPSCFNVDQPTIQFVDLARSLGVPGIKVQQPSELDSAVNEMLAHAGPFLLDLVLENSI